SSPWDSKAEMVMRDALLNDYLVPLDRLNLPASGFLLYKEGQSFLRFVDEVYGPEKVLLIIESSWKKASFYTILEEILEKDFKEIMKEWKYFYKKDIYPLLETGDAPRAVTVPLTKQGLNASPVYYSPGGRDKVIFVTNRMGYSDIYIQDLDPENGAQSPRLLLKGERRAELESLHFLQSYLDVSTDGILVFSSKSGANDVLNFFDIASRKMIYTFRDDRIISILSPSWSLDGTKVVFSGINWHGNQDLYVVAVEKMELTSLTGDFYADRNPSFSPDGRYVAFSSDRGEFGKEGYFNLFVYDTWNDRTDGLTHGPFNDISPRWSWKDADRLVFSSDRDGSYNLWMLQGVSQRSESSRVGTDDSATLTGVDLLVPRPLTHLVTGAFDPRWCGQDESNLLFTAFDTFEFQIHLLKNVEDRISPPPPERATFPGTGRPWTRPTLKAHADRKRLPYRKKYSFDIAQTAIAYDPVFGFLGGAQVTVSDLLGNDYYHFLLFNTAETSSDFLGRFNFAVNRVDLSRRINLGYGIFHFANDYFTYSDGFFFERRYGAQFALSYPFSVFDRIEVTSSTWRSQRNFFGGRASFEAFLVSNSMSYVHDNAIWGPVGPVDGMSLRLTVGQTIDFTRSAIYTSGLLADFRKYFRTSLRTLYALRLMTWLNQGRDVFRFHIGGSWGLRGFGRLDVAGRNFLLINNEFRFPFARQLVLRFSSFDLGLAPLRGAVFIDVGNAWDHRPDGLLGSFGLGLRGSLLGVMVLRLDMGKTTDFHSVSRRFFTQFFFGWNF
ncbi:MAG: hypothetical protein ACE5GH_02480, partial [Fidelibacterota bacterium]